MKQIETKRGARERFIGIFHTLALFTEESLMNVSWIVAPGVLICTCTSRGSMVRRGR